jgi:hypothetical protein
MGNLETCELYKLFEKSYNKQAIEASHLYCVNADLCPAVKAPISLVYVATC